MLRPPPVESMTFRRATDPTLRLKPLRPDLRPTERPGPAIDVHAVVFTAIGERAPLGLHLDAPLAGLGATRWLDATPIALVTGRDGRERVVLELAVGADGAETRVPLDRVTRAERLNATAPGQLDADTVVTRRVPVARPRRA
jgi:hypothetical protein